MKTIEEILSNINKIKLEAEVQKNKFLTEGFNILIERLEKNIERDRATGRTTRQANDIIELLFNYRGGWIIVEDHWAKDNDLSEYDSIQVSKPLLKIVVERLQREHRIKDDKFVSGILRARGKEIINSNRVKDYNRQYLMIKLNL